MAPHAGSLQGQFLPPPSLMARGQAPLSLSNPGCPGLLKQREEGSGQHGALEVMAACLPSVLQFLPLPSAHTVRPVLLFRSGLCIRNAH